jgi:hypothetical protein
LDRQARRDLPDRLGLQDLLARKVTRVPRVPRGHRVLRDCKERRDSPGPRAHRVRRARLGLRVSKGLPG